MKRNVIETLVGGIILLIAVGFALFAYKNAGLSSAKDSYMLFAQFESADGIKVGSDVRVGGVKIGLVTKTGLNMQTYRARIEMGVDNAIKFPTDSSAQIVSDGLLGGKYIALVPGGDDEMLASGGEIRFTQSSVNLETLIGKMIFSDTDKKPGKEKDDQGAAPSPASPPHLEPEAPVTP